MRRYLAVSSRRSVESPEGYGTVFEIRGRTREERAYLVKHLTSYDLVGTCSDRVRTTVVVAAINDL
jgi:hypothetical protein